MADADYFLFSKPIHKDVVFSKIGHLLPSKYAPLNAETNSSPIIVKANQGYLYELNNKIGDAINELANIKTELPFKIEDDKSFDDSDYKEPDKTSRKGLVISRVGQGKYRRKILR